MPPQIHLNILKKILNNALDIKYWAGFDAHQGEKRLWEMTDEELDKEIFQEITDLSAYMGEKIRRKNDTT